MGPLQTERKAFGMFSHGTGVILSAAALFLASLALPFADLWYAAFPAAFLLLFYVAFCSRRVWNILTIFFLLGLSWSLSASIAPGFVILALYVSLAAGSYLILTCKTPVFSLLATALAFGGAALLSGGALARALPALFPLPAYVFLSIAYARRERRSIVLLSAQAGLLAVLLALALTWFLRTYGALDRETILSVMDGLRSDLLADLRILREELQQNFTDAGMTLPASWESLSSDETLGALVRGATVLLPGIAAAACGVVAFFGHSLLLSLLQNENDEFAKTPDAILLVLGIPSATIYLVSSALTLFLDSGTLAYAVAQNFSVILLLPFCFSGLQRLLGMFLLAPKGGRLFVLVFFLALCCCLSVGAVELLALYAAFDTIFAPLRKKILSSRGNPKDRQDD